MKILVLGATGMAGHTISIYLKEKGHDVTGFSRRPFKYTKNIIGDITNFNHIKEVIDKGEYDAVINAIGILNEDAENNKSLAVLINSYLPHFLVDITKDSGSKIIHMSTDCVFSGEHGNYTEDSLKDGKTFYDRSKALGEINNLKDLTFRNSIIGPDLSKDGIGLFNWFMKQNNSINGYTKAIWSGVTTLTLAQAIEKALSEKIVGTYNLVNNDILSKYHLLQIFNDQFREGALEIIESDIVIINKSLRNTRKDFSFEVPSYVEMIKEMKVWIENHSELYPHYHNLKEI